MRRALLSVSDKTGIVDFAKGLSSYGIELISTGGTKKFLDEAGITTISIEEVTGFPEMMDGRVKTLHPKIHGGLLAKRQNKEHMDAMTDHDIQSIDFVCVNLYPFKETILNPNATKEDAIENIDIGGPSMLRSAAKNYESVTVVVDPSDYAFVLNELEANDATSYTLREQLAAKVFRHTAAYDALIAQYFTTIVGERTPEKLTLTYDLKEPLRYGENSHQYAEFYEDAVPVAFSIAKAEQLHGKALSYNNIKDGDAAIRIAREFEKPVAVVVKHMNPCGIGCGSTIEEAFQAAYDSDPVSIFGGIVVVNREVTVELAEALHDIFLEIVIAPSFATDAFNILAKKKNIRLLTLDFSQKESANEPEKVSVLGGLLVQEQDHSEDIPGTWKVVTDTQPTKEQWEALDFAWKAVKYVKSNAIVVTNDHQTLGIGAGQMNRVGSVEIAIAQSEEHDAPGTILASDAFFPMGDSVAYCGKHGIKAIIQPGGSIRDQESIDKANEYGIAMVFTEVRHFRH